ncbi:hypothetical protein CEUSTIGMA_g12812.t1 [Chlamydomonas eustigma]|uniref:T-complex protein 1 subunit alpha n=1 Tax=Chlamydomonas eustigma TaxID=1157962 RepID=A0A250XQR9_9CHLO|nr:hypothetical protein CEUSTIGMA_g12812.t1 [Chlamydomonas eustigma]|eukprot:GAX85396.1 hypothetical protein CEUSTIGMA_g12812.t1 [Chlamydomonas eustigma]
MRYVFSSRHQVLVSDPKELEKIREREFDITSERIKMILAAGGGAVEAALSVFLENFATTLGSREQLAIGEFANSALVLPKTLAVNAAKDATELIAALRAFHYKAQTSPDCKHMAQFGLDLVEGKVRNNVEAGVLEPSMSKVKMIQFATEAAITILRIDDLIRLQPSQDDQE